MKIKKICQQCGKIFKSKKNYELKNLIYSINARKSWGMCYKCKTKKYRKLAHILFKDDEYLFNYFKGKLFSHLYKKDLTELDKEIIRMKVQLFKIKRQALSADKNMEVSP